MQALWLVEVGAGTGSFSELLLERGPESLSLVEPSADMHRLPAERVGRIGTRSRVETYNARLGAVAALIRERERPDSVIYVNVLEHIADDEAEPRVVRGALGERGRAFLFVPALGGLYGSFDELIDRRRYSRRELEAKCRRAGFEVLKSIYFEWPASCLGGSSIAC